MRMRTGSAGMLMAAVAFFVAGCGQAENKGGKAQSKEGTGKKAEAVAAAKGHDHGGWWCDEHGIPEDECSMCSAKVAAEFKKKGDWCEEHDRGKSQCFLCDPKLKDKYAAKYRAKYGKEPPPIEQETPKKDEKKT